MINITIPTLHSGQRAIYRHPARFKAVRCGRRWGKTEFMLALGADMIINGKFVGYFVPEFKLMAEYYDRLSDIMQPLKKRSSKTEGVFHTKTGGRLDFWSLENEIAGRSRKYHLALIDEVAFAKDRTMKAQWERCIKPTLLDYGGAAIAASTPNGINEENWFYQINSDPKNDFIVFHAPTSTNPHLNPDDVAQLQSKNHPLVYRQEYLAEFVDWSSAAFFSLDNLLEYGEPYEPLYPCDFVYAVLDTASKTGTEHDGTACIYYAKSRFGNRPLMILDWDLVQIEGDTLESWLPVVFDNLAALAIKYRALMGIAGVWIEDKASGIILLQQATKKGLNVHYIDSKLTALGKDERAISISGYVYRGEVKLTVQAYTRLVTYKMMERNHLITQITRFKPGDKEAHKRADDLLDCFTYGIAIGLGNIDGY